MRGKRHIIGLVGLLCLTCFAIRTEGQQRKTSKVDILHSDNFEMDTRRNVTKFIGSVRLRHENMLMWCDSLYQYQDSNHMEAFGHVRAVQNDTVEMRGDYMFYDGNTRFIQLRLYLCKLRDNLLVVFRNTAQIFRITQHIRETLHRGQSFKPVNTSCFIHAAQPKLKRFFHLLFLLQSLCGVVLGLLELGALLLNLLLQSGNFLCHCISFLLVQIGHFLRLLCLLPIGSNAFLNLLLLFC